MIKEKIKDCMRDKPLETEEIREVCQIGNLNEANLTQVDIWLDAFEQAGIELRPEIDSYFEKFR
jgi:hypothetical protein